MVYYIKFSISRALLKFIFKIKKMMVIGKWLLVSQKANSSPSIWEPGRQMGSILLISEVISAKIKTIGTIFAKPSGSFKDKLIAC